jgi:hypothetical protein
METRTARGVVRLTGIIFVIAGLTAAGSASAGVTAFERESDIVAAVFTSPDSGTRLESSDGLSSFGLPSNFGPFDSTVSKTFDYPPGSLFDHAEAIASQKSSLSFANGNLTGVQVSGQASGLGLLEAKGTFSLIFDVVDEPASFLFSPFELRGGEGGTPGSGQLTFTDLTRHQVLRQIQSGDTGLPTEPEPSQPFDPDGALQPGRYLLLVEYGTRDDFGFGSANLGISFRATNAVPLPPAVWPGLVMLGICGGVRLFRK